MSPTLWVLLHPDPSPQFDVLIKLALVLNVPRAFLLRPPSQPDVDNLFYRSMSGSTKTDRLKARRRYIWLKEMTSYLRGFVRFPPVRVPAIDIPDELGAIDVNVIESAADQTRKVWGLGNGPISDVTLLLENNGVIVSKVTLGTMYMDGFSGWDAPSNTPYIILGDDKGSAVRSRFDIAHELGHLILHRGLSPQCIHDPINTKLIESQAHRFAGAFLLPSDTFSEDLYVISLDSLKALKSKWLVSIGAMLYRAQDLNLTTDGQYKKLQVNLNRRRWRQWEPLDDELVPECPRLLRRAFKLIIEKGIHPPEQILSDLCLSSSDVRELSCAGDGLLEGGEHWVKLAIKEAEVSRDLGITREYIINGGTPPNLN